MVESLEMRDVLLRRRRSAAPGARAHRRFPPLGAPLRSDSEERRAADYAASGLISELFARRALVGARRTGVTLEAYLIYELGVKETAIRSAQAAKLGVSFVNNVPTLVDADLWRRADAPGYLRSGVLPWRRSPGSSVSMAVCDPEKRRGRPLPLKQLARRRPFCLVSKAAFRQAIEAEWRYAFLEDASEGLARESALHSAKRRLTSTQWMGGSAVLAGIATLFIVAPAQAVLGFNVVLIAIFAPVLALRGFALAWAFARPSSGRQTSRLLRDHELPVYTILAPLYREVQVLDRLISDLDRLDYPRAKLDVKLIVEADDSSMLEALSVRDLPAHFHVVVTPVAAPRTKPKACNYALNFAEGEYVVIFDAEDTPHRQQLRLAASVFAEAANRVACLQAPLRYYNWDQNWLTRQFECEYMLQFRVLLPMLRAVDWPIPLGGTSNHFRADVLRRLGGWDAYNVTEDADIGLRLYGAGYKIDILPLGTEEEATSTTTAWRMQRARWIKGHLQTLLVFARRPAQRMRRMGARRYAGLQLVLGGATATAFVYPLFAIYILWSVIGLLFGVRSGIYGPLGPFNLTFGATGFLVSTLAVGFAAAQRERGKFRVLLTAFTAPAYQLLAGAAALTALRDLIKRPHHWRKTKHGPMTSRLGERVSQSVRRAMR